MSAGTGTKLELPLRDSGQSGNKIVSKNLNSEDKMSRVCAICGKTKANGGCITRKGLAKKAGGIGMHVIKNTKRTFEVNLQSVKINDGGTVKTVKLCAACIRTGDFQKA